MKPLSIKANITVWYTSLLVIVLAFVLIGVLYFSDIYMLSKAKNSLVDTVISNAADIDTKNGTYDLSELERYDNGVNIIVHNIDGTLLFGKYPNGFPENRGWTNVEVQSAAYSDKRWIYYDHIIKISGDEQILVRGIQSVDEVVATISTAALAALVLFPILIVFAALGGYRITQRALKPVKQITDTASDIYSGDDLSRRIGGIEFAGAGDEIQTLAETFDSMFERLQGSFERERQFTSDASHELRTPTSIIMSQSEFALSKKATKSEQEESLKIILSQSQKMSRLISQLLLIARAENSETRLSKEIFDFSELVEVVSAEMRISAKSKEIEIATAVQPNIMINADHLLIARLMVNIISNSIKYGKDGGFVKIEILQKNDQLVGQVIDDGIGIDAKSIDKVWERFYRVNESHTSDNTDSMGLGLPMAKWIVEAHGGRISISSTPGDGTTVTFSLPISG